MISFGFYKVKQAASFPSGHKADAVFIHSLSYHIACHPPGYKQVVQKQKDIILTTLTKYFTAIILKMLAYTLLTTKISML